MYHSSTSMFEDERITSLKVNYESRNINGDR
jgi:hypothetical protein